MTQLYPDLQAPPLRQQVDPDSMHLSWQHSLGFSQTWPAEQQMCLARSTQYPDVVQQLSEGEGQQRPDAIWRYLVSDALLQFVTVLTLAEAGAAGTVCSLALLESVEIKRIAASLDAGVVAKWGVIAIFYLCVWYEEALGAGQYCSAEAREAEQQLRNREPHCDGVANVGKKFRGKQLAICLGESSFILKTEME